MPCLQPSTPGLAQPIGCSSWQASLTLIAACTLVVMQVPETWNDLAGFVESYDKSRPPWAPPFALCATPEPCEECTHIRSTLPFEHSAMHNDELRAPVPSLLIARLSFAVI